MFNIFSEISSYPSDYRELIIFSISLVEVLLNFIFGEGFFK